MNVYMYQAALHCEECGKAIRAKLDAEGKTPDEPDDENAFDSDDYPKGPYADGGGEADCPQHCDSCGVFLENDLTSEGVKYVSNAIREYSGANRRGSHTVVEWFAFYSEQGVDVPELTDPEEQDDEN